MKLLSCSFTSNIVSFIRKTTPGFFLWICTFSFSYYQISHNVFKRALDLNGAPIEAAKKEDITLKSKNETHEIATLNKTEDYCGSCYGAKDGCCNTCEDVRQAYRYVVGIYLVVIFTFSVRNIIIQMLGNYR